LTTYLTIFSKVLPVFGLMFLGYLLRRKKWLNAEADRSLIALQINIWMPCFIFKGVLGNEALSRMDVLIAAPLTGAMTILAGISVARIIAPLIGLHDATSRNTFMLCSGMHNYGYLAIPLAVVLFDIRTLGVLFLVNVGVEAMMWIAGPMLLSKTPVSQSWRKIFNPPLFSIVAGLSLTQLHLDTALPSALLEGIGMMGDCAVPMALLMIGAMIGDHFQPRFSAGGTRVVIGAVAHRLLILPLLMLGAAMILPVTDDLKRVLILHAAMPSAVFPIVLVKHHQGSIPVALQVVLGTSFVSIVTIPLWIIAGKDWLGL